MKEEKKIQDDDKPFKWPLKGVSGASAGALTGFLVALHYTPKEIAELTVRDGLFVNLFSESLRPGTHSAVASHGAGRGLKAPYAVGYFNAGGHDDGYNRAAALAAGDKRFFEAIKTENNAAKKSKPKGGSSEKEEDPYAPIKGDASEGRKSIYRSQESLVKFLASKFKDEDNAVQEILEQFGLPKTIKAWILLYLKVLLDSLLEFYTNEDRLNRLEALAPEAAELIAAENEKDLDPVSYTHLTLPTKA